MSISVAFVDDHPILLEGLVSLYSGKSDLEIVAKGENAVDALKIVEEFSPEVLVLDLSMPGDAIAAIELVTQKYKDTRIIVFTANSSIETAIQVLNYGVSGYVLKGSSASDLHEAIRTVYDGETFITAGFATKVIMAMKTAEIRRRSQAQRRLSLREEQIVRHLMRGSTNREIAACLDISEKTVKHYMTVLMQKLDVRNRVEVVLAAQRLDVLPDGSAERSASRRIN
ncbi:MULTISPECIES: response regulator transcription factor [Ensifer]|jgi:DNA-binding NarL/FixJ family response regulator|uniref:Response regulator n=1 Tax=Ensifer canadensis TaxID=555315 RepID=A0AAW4FVT1_9HYPH|nr:MULTISPECIES: response regulator transcription factor [Ensifer]AHK42269.1 putative CitB, response regulator containing a CheY-like receiver domain and an HTH DNA-binding domain CitB [Ensifer adhaerens OV14]MDP9634052.1 DNA-binding NarL/FixJ family response regulator [Ensifer adhaerens]KQU91193.1 two-component system response regulator [Ensifer sp. Root31]KQW39650.1 two-component system response regulator [Ensifer sp. Root1252]KQW59918.1 two-component system response regulator [Ensifer sp. R